MLDNERQLRYTLEHMDMTKAEADIGFNLS